ncbi:MAG: N-acetylneuraminate synthase family protein [Methanofastidiosum sp.]|nr:N-acetylneuraminate synthase family protein [Methanocellales archaeon]
MSNKVFVIGEIGINGNGDMNLTRSLIRGIKNAGADAVKFQKRIIEETYTKEFLDSPRESPWGTTQRAQKEGLEYSFEDYQEIDSYCKEIGIYWFASAWSVNAQLFLRKFNLKHNKIASPMLTNLELLKTVAEESKYTFISTGMSTLKEISDAVDIFQKYNCPFEIMHCNSAYPSLNKDANLYMIDLLRQKFKCKVGFSSHEDGRVIALSAVALGATSIEKHITLSKDMYGSDQKASLELDEFKKLIIDIREIEPALDIDVTKNFSEAELAVRKKLRGN